MSTLPLFLKTTQEERKDTVCGWQGGELVEGTAENSTDFQRQKILQVDSQRNLLTVHHLPGMNYPAGQEEEETDERSEREETRRSEIQEGGICKENELDQQGLEGRKGWGGLGEEEVEVASENHSLDKCGLRRQDS